MANAVLFSLSGLSKKKVSGGKGKPTGYSRMERVPPSTGGSCSLLSMATSYQSIPVNPPFATESIRSRKRRTMKSGSFRQIDSKESFL
jgi:hypothetical protein